MAYFPSSAPQELVHWHGGGTPEHLRFNLTQITQNVSEAANDALYNVEQFIATNEDSFQKIAEHFGIAPFELQLSNKKDIEGVTFRFYPKHQFLEIHRPNQKYATSFPVQLAV